MWKQKNRPDNGRICYMYLETNFTQIYYKYLFFSIFLLFVIIRLADVALRYVERSEEILFI